MLNGLSSCKGVITRIRETINNIEKSAIDFVLMSADLSNFIDSMLIDKERKHVLTKITKSKVIKSDHNVLISKMKFKWNKKENIKRREIFNF